MDYDNGFYDEELDREYGTTTVEEAIKWELQNRVKTDKDADEYIVEYDFAKGGEVADINKFKKQLIAKAKRKGLYENFGQAEVRKLEDKYGYSNNVIEFDNWAMNFDLSQMAKGGKTKRSKHSLMQDRRRVSSESWEVAYQKRKSKMEAGGTLPTPFGQAGLVGETGAMNEMDMFAMGGGLPQGVHQYYAQTYNPAYPTPHGYAKGGYLEGKTLKSKKFKTKEEAEKSMNNLKNLSMYDKDGKKIILRGIRIEKEQDGYIATASFLKKDYRFAKGGTLYGDGKMYKYTKNGVVKEVRDVNGKLLKEITNKGKKYRRNSTYKTYNSVEGNELLNQSHIGNKMAKGGKTQGYNDKLDESLGNTKGKRSTKEQNYKDRRNESEAMEKKGGKRKYASVKTMDKGSRKKRRTPMSVAKEIRKEGEEWQDAVKRASAMLKKK